MIIRDPSFVLSAMTTDQLGDADVPEVAFIGRSNVGKSSLMGMLMQRASLVKVSRTPGRTRALNLFTLTVQAGDERRALRFVDLPGYGYARISKGERSRLTQLLTTYLAEREGVSVVCQLIDSRHTPTQDDRDVFEGLQTRPSELIVVATKADKIVGAKRKQAIRKVGKALGGVEPLAFSVPAKFGMEPLWHRIWRATGDDE